MSEAATQQGVEQQENEVKFIDDSRKSLVEEIAAKAQKERDDEIKRLGGETVDTSAPPAEEPAQEPVAEVPQEEPAPQEEAKPEPTEEFVTVKVDGELKQVPKDKIYEAGLRAVQKESAADKRLEEATRLLKEIEQKFAPKQDSQPPQEWDAATIAYALEHGDENQKRYAVEQLKGRSQPSPDEIARVAEQRVLDTVDFRTTSEWFQTEYKDVWSDPYLARLAAIKEDELRASGDTRPRKELYKSIGDELRKWKGGTVNIASLDQKREQKKQIENLPSASVRKAAPEQPKAKTPSDIINEMRNKRIARG